MLLDTAIYESLGETTDTASATGPLHAKIGDLKNRLDYGVVPRFAIASDATKYEDLAEAQYAVGLVTSTPNIWTEWTRLRSAKVFFNGTVRVVFDAEEDVSGTGRVAVLVNREGRGTLRNSLSTSYETYSEDFYVAYGDEIAVFGGYTSGGTCDILIQNFKIKFDVANAASSGVARNY